MKVSLLNYPSKEVILEVKRRAMITVFGRGLGKMKDPPADWLHRILEARHSPIRYMMYSFMFEDIPSNTSVHLCRHVHAQPYVSSLRNDRQEVMDGDLAPRNTPVNMILDVNGEEIQVIANKRLCMKASEYTRQAVKEMCSLVLDVTPDYDGLLVPLCEYCGGVCHEMFPCGRHLK